MTEEELETQVDLQLKRIDTYKLYPKYLKLVRRLLRNCILRNAYYVATSGMRTYEEQNELYAQGRTKPGKICTKAKGGQSNHNFGTAIDFAPHVGGVYTGKLKLDYSEKNYIVLAEEARALGLEWGGDWVGINDTPHVQLGFKQNQITLADLRYWYGQKPNGGYKAVFKFLDKYKWERKL